MLSLQGGLVETTGPMSARRRKASGSRSGVLWLGAGVGLRGWARVRWTGGREEGSDAGRVVGRAGGSGEGSPGR